MITVEVSKPPMTLQQYYDKIVAAVNDGTLPSFSKGNCLYHYTDKQTCKEHRCVAGLLLEAEDFDKVCELKCVINQDHKKVFEMRCPKGLTVGQLRILQDIYDWYNSTSEKVQPWNKNQFINQVNLFFLDLDPNIQTVPVNPLEA